MSELLQQAAKALTAKGYTVRCFSNKKEALTAFLEEVPVSDTIGFGGSVTVAEMGLCEALMERGTTIYSHWHIPEGETAKTVQEKAGTADLYVCSSNAVTLDGKLVNVDGTGNRLASILYGHKRCYFMVGVNKIVADQEAAMERLRAFACPLNAKRLNKKTPCVKTGRCMDCNSPERICNFTLILERQTPTGVPCTIYLIDEALGL